MHIRSSHPQRKSRLATALLLTATCAVLLAQCGAALGQPGREFDPGEVKERKDTSARIYLDLPPTRGQQLDVTVFYGTERGIGEDWQESHYVPWQEATFPGLLGCLSMFHAAYGASQCTSL